MKVAHVISDTDTGGAEMMLLKLTSALDRRRYEPVVITLVGVGPVGERLRSLGVAVHCLGMRRGVPDPRAVWRLARLIRAERPDVVQTWMYHADLIGGIAAKLAGGVPVAWNIRHSVLDPALTKPTTIWTARACARFSRRLPTRIVCCSKSSRTCHALLGYTTDRMVVIPNGFDLGVFHPDPAAGPSLRRELSIPASVPLIGLVGRFDPQKDHATFLAAGARLAESHPDVHFLLCGAGVTLENVKLAAAVDRAGLRGRCHLLGRRSDMPRIQAALDIAVSSSITEGFPNVVGEAMACGVPCAVTDVGDSALIVGETGRVVPPRDAEGLSHALNDLLSLPAESRAALGAAARVRLSRLYSLPAIAARYAFLYDGIVHGSSLSGPPFDTPAGEERIEPIDLSPSGCGGSAEGEN